VALFVEIYFTVEASKYTSVTSPKNYHMFGMVAGKSLYFLCL